MTAPQALTVDADLLHQLGADLQGQADQVTGLDAGPVFDPVAGAFSDSDTAWACRQALAAIKAALTLVAGRLAQMSRRGPLREDAQASETRRHTDGHLGDHLVRLQRAADGLSRCGPAVLCGRGSPRTRQLPERATCVTRGNALLQAGPRPLLRHHCDRGCRLTRLHPQREPDRVACLTRYDGRSRKPTELDGIPSDQVGDHIWSTKAANDPVPLAAHSHQLVPELFGKIGGMLGGQHGEVLGTGAGDVLAVADQLNSGHTTGPFGLDPTDSGFGGHTFTSDPGQALPLIGYNPSVHSSYWDGTAKDPSESLKNMALIIAGRTGAVQ